MAKMKPTEAAVRVLEAEGVTTAFGVPGAAINPFYAAMREHGRIRHILAKLGMRCGVIGTVEIDDGKTRREAQMTTPSATEIAQRPEEVLLPLEEEDFQAIDIEAIAKPVAKWAVTVREAGLVPRVFQQAFHVMRSGRPGPVLIDLPIDVQLSEIEFEIDTYQPLPV